MPDDATLLRRYARERAEDAFAELVRRHLDAVYSAALRRVGGDTHLAEDVAQQVFIALGRNADALAERELLSGWLYTTTRHLAANVVRGERRRKAREQSVDFMSETNSARDRSDRLDPFADAEADWNRVSPLLDAAIDALGEIDRTAILLRFVERRAFGEIGAALRLSEDAARMRVDRALDKLRAQLARRGIASTSAALGVAMANHTVAAAPVGLAASVTTTASAAAAAPALGFTGAALTAGEIMTTAKSIGLAAALVALIAALGTAIYEANAHRDADAALAAEQQAHAVQLAQLNDTERRARLAEAEVARLQKSVDDARAAQAVVTARAAAEAEAAKKDAAWDGVAEGKSFLARHPEVKRLLDDSKIAAVRARYAPFFASAQLSPEQIEEFLRLRLTGNVSGFPDGPGGKMLILSAGTDITPQEAGKRLKALLGDDGFKQFGQFEATIPARDATERIASALVFSDAPLGPAQANELAEILSGARIKLSGSNTMVIDWNAAADRAQGFLAEPQLRVLAGVRAQYEAQRAATKE